MRNLRHYFRPRSPEEAVSLKREWGSRAVYLAGGSDVMVHRYPSIEAVIDIMHTGLGYSQQGDGATIGGAALLRDVEQQVGDVANGMLRLALRETAPWLIRNSATVSGNIANASPGADSVPALMTLDASLVLLGDGEEQQSIEDVLVGPHQTNLGDRLIKEIRISKEAAARRGVFIKLAPSMSGLAWINVAVALVPDGEVARDVRIALGAVAPVVMRAERAEALLEGQRVTTELLQQVAQTVKDEVRPISDWRTSADYRRRMSGVLVSRAIRQALKGTGSGEVI